MTNPSDIKIAPDVLEAYAKLMLEFDVYMGEVVLKVADRKKYSTLAWKISRFRQEHPEVTPLEEFPRWTNQRRFP